MLHIGDRSLTPQALSKEETAMRAGFEANTLKEGEVTPVVTRYEVDDAKGLAADLRRGAFVYELVMRASGEKIDRQFAKDAGWNASTAKEIKDALPSKVNAALRQAFRGPGGKSSPELDALLEQAGAFLLALRPARYFALNYDSGGAERFTGVLVLKDTSVHLVGNETYLEAT